MAKNASQRARASRLITAEKRESPDIGTALANYSPTLSCDLAQPSEGQRGTWGGARNRADRVSDRLTDKQVAALMESARYAFATGRVFQRHWTVHYGLAGILPSDAMRFIGKLLDLLGRRARRYGGRLTAIWVRECASNKGEHVHILLHLPAGMNLRNLTRRLIVAAGGTYRKGVSKVTVVGGRLAKVEGSREARQVANAENVMRYVLKASAVETGERLGLTRVGKSGNIVGKRWGRTQNIGRMI